jgi:hypothetical protein
VYITEAHSQDEWPMGDEVLVERQPTEMGERCQVATEFQQNTQYRMPMVVDTMQNRFDGVFGAWPVRFFIVQNNQLVFKAQPTSEHAYDLQEVRNWLTKNC